MTSDYYPPPGTIQVLEWVPPQIAPDFPGGLWSLEAVGDWLNLDLPVRDVECIEGGMDADPEALGEWVAEVLGHPVSLTGEDDIIGVAYGPFRPPFAGGNRVTRAICLHWPHRKISRRFYWVTA